jgi:hypothetical protein
MRLLILCSLLVAGQASAGVLSREQTALAKAIAKNPRLDVKLWKQQRAEAAQARAWPKVRQHLFELTTDPHLKSALLAKRALVRTKLPPAQHVPGAFTDGQITLGVTTGADGLQRGLILNGDALLERTYLGANVEGVETHVVRFDGAAAAGEVAADGDFRKRWQGVLTKEWLKTAIDNGVHALAVP